METITFNEWGKLDIRVGKIVEIKSIEGADKLYKLKIDVGSKIGERVVCAGLKNYYSEKELLGKKVVLFVNLAPRKMKGIESQGMILAAVNDDESEVFLISPEKDIEIGSRIM